MARRTVAQYKFVNPKTSRRSLHGKGIALTQRQNTGDSDRMGEASPGSVMSKLRTPTRAFGSLKDVSTTNIT